MLEGRGLGFPTPTTVLSPFGSKLVWVSFLSDGQQELLHAPYSVLPGPCGSSDIVFLLSMSLPGPSV